MSPLFESIQPSEQSTYRERRRKPRRRNRGDRRPGPLHTHNQWEKPPGRERLIHFVSQKSPFFSSFGDNQNLKPTKTQKPSPLPYSTLVTFSRHQQSLSLHRGAGTKFRSHQDSSWAQPFTDTAALILASGKPWASCLTSYRARNCSSPSHPWLTP